MDQLLLGIELKILAGTGGIADPAIVEFNDKRLQPFPLASDGVSARRSGTSRAHTRSPTDATTLSDPPATTTRSSASTGPWNQTS